jgi:DNA ligase (NAD+)
MAHPVTGALAGKTFVMTGSLSSMKRSEAKEQILRRGGRVSSSVSSSTDYLVAGEAPGSKFSEAEKKGVVILNGDEFLELLNTE